MTDEEVDQLALALITAQSGVMESGSPDDQGTFLALLKEATATPLISAGVLNSMSKWTVIAAAFLGKEQDRSRQEVLAEFATWHARWAQGSQPDAGDTQGE